MPKLEETVQVLQELINDLQPAKNDPAAPETGVEPSDPL